MPTTTRDIYSLHVEQRFPSIKQNLTFVGGTTIRIASPNIHLSIELPYEMESRSSQDKRVIEYLNHTLKSRKLCFVLHLPTCYEYLQRWNFGGDFRGLLYLEIPVQPRLWTLSCTCNNSIFYSLGYDYVYIIYKDFQSALFAAYEVGSVCGRIGILSTAMGFKLLGAEA